MRQLKSARQSRPVTAMIGHGLIPQSRSGCSSPRAPAPRPARPSRFSACRAITSRSAIPRPGALRGTRVSSGNFTAVRGCGTTRPDIWLSSSSCWPTEQFDVLLPTHEQGFLFARVQQRLAGRVGLALPDFESYRAAHSKAGFSRLLDRLGLPQPPTRIVTSAQQVARRHPLSCGGQDLGRHRQPRHLVRARCGRSRNCVARTQRRRRIRRRGAGAGSHRGHDRKGAIGVLPRPD